MTRAGAVALALMSVASIAAAQVQKPRLELVASVTPASVAAGARAKATLKVRMPTSVHVQSDKPKDPSLIPTLLTINPPAGVTVERIVYPVPSTLNQEGRSTPLSVFGPELVIDVQLAIASTVSAGEMRVPGQLRYQACDERVCFPPARAPVEWVLTVSGPQPP